MKAKKGNGLDITPAIVLITSDDPGVRDMGTGFVIGRRGSSFYVATCRHVLGDGKVRVNHLPCDVVADGSEKGIDLAVVRVKDLCAEALPVDRKSISPGTHLYGYAYRHLHGDHYILEATRGKSGRFLRIRTQKSVRAVDAWQFGYDSLQVVGGHSGSPLIRARDHQVVGIVSYSLDSGSEGVAIGAGALFDIWDDFEKIIGKQEGEPDFPPPPDDVVHEDDPQKDRFGGRASKSGRRLVARIHSTKDKSYFDFQAVVESTDGTPLVPPFRFFLHNTFARSVLTVKKTDEARHTAQTGEFWAYGAFTIGCQVKDKEGNWIELEYDLMNSRSLPARFKKI